MTERERFEEWYGLNITPLNRLKFEIMCIAMPKIITNGSEILFVYDLDTESKLQTIDDAISSLIEQWQARARLDENS